MVKYVHSLSKYLTIKLNKDFSPAANNCYQYCLFKVILPSIILRGLLSLPITKTAKPQVNPKWHQAMFPRRNIVLNFLIHHK